MASRDSGTVRPTKRMRVFFAAAVLLIVCVLTAGAVSAVEVETFTELKNAINFASAEDTIYIVGDITVPEDESLSISTSITLSPLTENVSISRGGAATANQNGMFTIWDGGSLTIQGFDSASTSSHTLTLDGKKDDYPNNEQTLVWINGGGSFTLKEGGILTNNSVTGTGGDGNPKSGGAVYVNGGTFRMEGGEISNNKAKDNGGGVYVKSGTFTMTGGSITNNKAEFGFGGALCVDGDNNEVTITLSGGEISNNTATNGGGVFMKGSQTAITLSGTAKISNNKAVTENEDTTLSTGHGGGVHIDDGMFSITDSATITGNKAGKNGGGVYVHFGGTFVMSGGEISKNTASSYGGGVHVGAAATQKSQGTFTMSDGTITDNTAESGGAVMLEEAGKFTMEGGTISNNTATNGGGVFMKGESSMFDMSGGTIFNNTAYRKSSGTGLGTGRGGGVHIDEGTFTMSNNAKIAGNTAMEEGGGVYVHFGGTFVMSGGEISKNTANTNGGGVCANTTGVFKMSNGKITRNEATGSGGGVCMKDGSLCFTMSGGTIIENSAANGNGVYVGSIFNLEGNGMVDSVYLPDGKNITVIGSLTGTETQVTGIIPADPQKDLLVVDLAKVSENYLSQFKLDSSVEKFALKWKQEEPMGLVLVPTHTVSFQAYEGTPVPDTQTVNDGDTVTKPIEPAKDGHTFAGWHEDASFITLWDFDTQVTKDLILHAKWTEKPSPEPPSGGGSSDGNMDNAYRVLFNDGATTLYVVTDLSAGDKLTKPEDPVKDGYTFAGWHKDTACTQPWDFNDGITGDMTLYAKWTPQETVTPTATATPTVTATATITSTPTGDASPAPTSQPDTNGNNGDNPNGETTKTSGISLPYLIGGIAILLLAILLLLILLLRHTVTFLIPTGGELEEYRIKVWHGRYINTEDLPDLIRTAAWYRDTERQERWDFDQDRVKKSIELYLG